jgi:cobalamin biosynthesis Mg chelatase CobN
MYKIALIFVSLVIILSPFVVKGFGASEGVRAGDCDFSSATVVRLWDKTTFTQVDIDERGFMFAPELWDTQTGSLDFNQDTATYFYTQLEPAFEAIFFIGDDTNMEIVGLIEVRYGAESAWVFIQDQNGYDVVDQADRVYDWHGCAFYEVPYYSGAAPLVWFNVMYNRTRLDEPLTMQ